MWLSLKCCVGSLVECTLMLIFKFQCPFSCYLLPWTLKYIIQGCFVDFKVHHRKHLIKSQAWHDHAATLQSSKGCIYGLLHGQRHGLFLMYVHAATLQNSKWCIYGLLHGQRHGLFIVLDGLKKMVIQDPTFSLSLYWSCWGKHTCWKHLHLQISYIGTVTSFH